MIIFSDDKEDIQEREVQGTNSAIKENFDVSLGTSDDLIINTLLPNNKALSINANANTTDNTSVKPTDTRSPMLKVGTYPLVSTHIELFRSNKSPQVSCLVSGLDSGSASFFRAIKPWGLENYLDNYKLGGDLLKALHMTREEDGKFLYRSQFETVEEDDKIVCFEEHR